MVVPYQRDTTTRLAPPEWKRVTSVGQVAGDRQPRPHGGRDWGDHRHLVAKHDGQREPRAASPDLEAASFLNAILSTLPVLPRGNADTTTMSSGRCHLANCAASRSRNSASMSRAGLASLPAL